MSAGRQRIRSIWTSLFLACAAFLVLAWACPAWIATWNDRLNDKLFLLRLGLSMAPAPSPGIVHLNIDDHSSRVFGGQLRKRAPFVDVFEALGRMDVRAVVSDLVFTDPDAEVDAGLAKAIASARLVYLPVALDLGGRKSPVAAVPPLPPGLFWHPVVRREGAVRSASGLALRNEPAFERAAKALGHINCPPDPDGTYRRMPLLYRLEEGWVPSVSLCALAELLQVDTARIQVEAGRRVVLPGALRRGVRQDIVIPVDDECRVVVDFTRRFQDRDSFAQYPIATLLAAIQADREGKGEAFERLSEEMTGAVVILADSSTAGHDFGATPLEEGYPLSGLHANLMSMVLKGEFIAEWRGPGRLGYELAVLLLATVLAVRLRRARTFLAAMAGVFLLDCGLTVLLFLRFGVLVQPVALSAALVFLALSAAGLRFAVTEGEKIALRARFESFMAPAVIEKVVRNPSLLDNVQKKDLTILFSDVSGFTTWSSRTAPEAIHGALGDYFDAMTGVVFKHGGTVDKFIGDGLMVFFGDPVDQPDHALRAVRAAVEMQERCRELRPRMLSVGLDLKVRIGVNTGPVVVGNMGSAKRMDYTVIGADVNLAQRLESSAPLGGVLLSASTAAALAGAVPLRPYGRLRVKGLADELETHEVVLDHLAPPPERREAAGH